MIHGIVSFRVLFVCTGNICRSPTVEGVFRAQVRAAGLAEKIEADSAATEGYHCGEPPDLRSQQAARQRGIDLRGLRARRVTEDDFRRFNMLLAMDRSHLGCLHRLAPSGGQERIRLFLDFAPGQEGKEVPDPYYGGQEGFQQVLDLAEAGAKGLLAHIRRVAGV